MSIERVCILIMLGSREVSNFLEIFLEVRTGGVSGILKSLERFFICLIGLRGDFLGRVLEETGGSSSEEESMGVTERFSIFFELVDIKFCKN